jgi:polyphosphate kinase
MKASNGGVKIELIARSICCVAPGIKKQSENITIRRIR